MPARVSRMLPMILALYGWAFSAMWVFILLLPLVVLVAGSWAIVAIAVHIVTHPELLVTGGFDFAWSVPEYFRWAGSRMASQFMNETSSRIR